ncbi:MAG: TrmH family RNA methyltransferase [Flavobacteriaceae bacterium]
MKHITSTQNKEIKRLMLLQSKSKVRRAEKQFIVEGRRELQLAQLAGYEVLNMYWCPELFSAEEFALWKQQLTPNLEPTTLTQEVYQKIAFRKSTEGVIAVLRQNDDTLEHYRPAKNALIVVLESIEKPGNLGAVLRTAEATAVDAVLVTEQHTDIHNPNVIRSSVGGFFATPIFVCSNEQANAFLLKNNIPTYAAVLQKSISYTAAEFSLSTAIVLGSEAKGLSDYWLQNHITPIKIPMLGQVDSLNVSVAAAVLLYEIQRQRNV